MKLRHWIGFFLIRIDFYGDDIRAYLFRIYLRSFPPPFTFCGRINFRSENTITIFKRLTTVIKPKRRNAGTYTHISTVESYSYRNRFHLLLLLVYDYGIIYKTPPYKCQKHAARISRNVRGFITGRRVYSFGVMTSRKFRERALLKAANEILLLLRTR